jgi:hypothetical protein
LASAPAQLDHPEQLQAEQVVLEFVQNLRECHTVTDYDALHRALFHAVYTTDEKRADVARLAKRQAKGRSVPPGDWQLELFVADRIARQLRSVGDALAWRCYGFDRAPLIALSANSPPGPLVGKTGLEAELGAAEAAVRERGTFALLHDLTNTLRIGDLTEFTENGPRVHEVKLTPSGQNDARAARQRQRLRQAIAAVNDGGPLRADGTRLVRSSIPLSTHLGRLEDIIRRASRERFVVEPLEDQMVLSVLCVDSPELATGAGESQIEAYVDAREQRAFKAAGLDTVEPHLVVHALDQRDASAAIAPYSIFPVAPDLCAGLVTDRIAISITLGGPRLRAEFTRRGWATHWPRSGGRPSDAEVLLATKDNFTLTMHPTALVQALVEQHEVRTFVGAFIDSATTAGEGSALLAFGSEHLVWR